LLQIKIRRHLVATALLILISYPALADTLGIGAPTATQMNHCLDAWNQPEPKCMAFKNKCEKAGGTFFIEEGAVERAPEGIYYTIFYKCKSKRGAFR
jgi:hypothetical protein